MRRAPLAMIAGLLALATTVTVAQQPSTSAPVFRSGVNLTLVDVVVRDRHGASVGTLTADDFELFENGTRQSIATFSFEEIKTGTPAVEAVPILAGAATGPLVGTNAVAGHRLLVLVFDASSMPPEDMQEAVAAAKRWVDERMSSADLVAVASIGSTLSVRSDFTGSKEQIRTTLSALAAEGAWGGPDTSGRAIDVSNPGGAADEPMDDELETLNNDMRFRALRTIAETLSPIQQKKSIIYFSGGIEPSGAYNQVELRAAINASVRANVSIYPVDARGLQAVVPGGSAHEPSRGGIAGLNANVVADELAQLSEEQETLHRLAGETGGTAFTDTNEFGDAFAKVASDTASYYILGFASTNTASDGRFRRISVRLRKKSDLRVDARAGYYADRDFTHTARADRERQLQEQLTAAIPATDVPLFMWTGYFRSAPGKYYVPIDLIMPGDRFPASVDKLTLDVAATIHDERGIKVGRIRDTVVIPRASGALNTKQVLYQTAVTLPPGRFVVKAVVRENTTGQMGSFEAPVNVGEPSSSLKMSSLVFSTQTRRADSQKTSPLVRDGSEIVPNLTRVAGRGQVLRFYYEVYDPDLEANAYQVQSNLVLYRNNVKVFETPIVERQQLNAADRRAVTFEVDIPGGTVPPGVYTCQVNVIDRVAGEFAFPRLDLYVR